MADVTTSAAGSSLVVHGVGDLRLDPAPAVVPRSDEAIVEIAYGGICGSDLHYWLHGAAGESILREPLVLGHEVVGTVTQAAADGSGPRQGTRVAVHPATPGGSGVRYPEDRPNLSPGCTYLGSAARFPHTQGAFSQHAVLPARMLRPLPEGLTLRAAALAEPASVAWHAVARAGDVRGKRVLVIGSGPIGCLAITVLKRAGAADIIAVDLHEEPLQTARRVGATRTVLATDAEAIASVEADVTLESSGNHRGLDSAIRGTMRGGKVVMVGLLPSGEQPVSISLAITRELDLLGSFRFNTEMDDVLEALGDGSLFVDPVITHEYPFSEALEPSTPPRTLAAPVRSCSHSFLTLPQETTDAANIGASPGHPCRQQPGHRADRKSLPSQRSMGACGRRTQYLPGPRRQRDAGFPEHRRGMETPRRPPPA